MSVVRNSLATLIAIYLGLIPAPLAARLVADAALEAVGGVLAGSSESRRSERSVARGVTHITDYQATGPLLFNVLKVDLADPALTLEVEPGRDQLFSGEAVPETARRESRPGHAVIGAVNGDFWSMSPRPYTPIGMLVANGMICRGPGKRSVFGITEDEKAFFDPVTLTTTVSGGGKSIEVQRINDLAATDSPTLFTPPVGPVLTRSAMPRVVLELDIPEFLPNKPVSAKVVRLAKPGETISMSARTVVLAAPEADLKKIPGKPGSKVTLDARVPEVDGVIAFCSGAAPRIVRDGQVSVEDKAEKLAAGFAGTRHPRTAAGVSADGRTLYLVTVDGRQPSISVGQALRDLARYMISLGCSDAVNLDGGGSTTMVVRGDVVNSPSDAGGPRRVVNSLLVVSSRPVGPLAQIEITPSANPLVVPAGTQVELGAEGYDADFSPVALSPASTNWSAERVGQIQPAQTSGVRVLNVAGGPASGTVRVQNGSIADEVRVEVVPVETVTVAPEVLLLSSGESVPLKVEASGAGRRIPLQAPMVRLSTSDRSLSASASVVTGVTQGQGELQITVGSASKRIPYFVDRFEAKSIASFDELPDGAKAGGSNFETGKTKLSRQVTECPEGSGCLAVEYGMSKSGGRSEITIPVDATIENEPLKLGLWIRGDGKQAWVRGELVDAAGTRFLVDFTEGAKGILWKDEWRRVTVPVTSLTSRGVKPGTRPRFPAKFRSLSISQEQEALKASGQLVFDGLEALHPPPAGGARN